MSEVLVQNRIIAGNNHHLVTENTELENKRFEVEQSESNLKVQVSAKSIEFSEEMEILLGELSSMKISNEELLLELHSRIEILEDDVQLKKMKNENLQHKVELLQKCDLDFFFERRAATASRLRRKFYARRNINNNENERGNEKKLAISKRNTYSDGELTSDVANAFENMERQPNKNLGNYILQWSIWKRQDDTNNSDQFSMMQRFSASTSTTTHVAEKVEGIPGEENPFEIVTLSDSES
ncbi:unnamed protein product [Orchesella dallaii]|uniref:Uncharacterized protein n=1 Tax=Orchesella dallaii TaxID=48710 RepID=A0ABP1QEK5_9HEXA